MDSEDQMKAMVLCAGYGTRLGELTREVPKPMLPVEGHPLLAYILGNLKRHGFDQFAINLHFKPEAIQNYFGDGTAQGMQFKYVYEPALLGTAGGLKNCEAFFRSEPAFLVHYGDIITDQDFSAMLRFHNERRALATLLLHQRARSNSVVTLGPDGQLTGFLERPTDEARRGETSPWVNSGICICHPEILDAIPPQTACDLPRDIFIKLVGTGRLYGFPLSGHRWAIDSPERLAQAQTALRDGTCRIVPVPS
jgi:NDP-sugar pyrophosphorylase family protein